MWWLNLDPIKVVATVDSVLWNIPSLNPNESWAVTHLFSGGFSGWSQAAIFLNHNFSRVSISSQVAIELDRRTAYTWSTSFGHEIYAAPLGPDFTPPPGGHFGIVGSVHEKTFLRALSWTSNSIFTLSPPCILWPSCYRWLGLS